jgi:hypothetical protein
MTFLYFYFRQVIKPQATAATGMQVMGPDGVAIALGQVKASLSPPLRVVREYPALSVTAVKAADVGSAFVFDFGFNMAGVCVCVCVCVCVRACARARVCVCVCVCVCV